MIEVQLDRREFEYDVHALVKAFYPGEKVVFAKAGEEGGGESPLFLLQAEFGAGEIRVSLRREGQLVAEAQEPLLETERPEVKNRLKRLLYGVLSAYGNQKLPWGTLTGIRPTKIPMAFLEQGAGEEEIRAYMRETYLISEEKLELCLQVARRELGILRQADYEAGYSLYIGIPFCPSTCLYCSFTSYPIARWKDQVETYLETLFLELDFVGRQFAGRRLDTVYVGGGTPTTLSAAQLDRLLGRIEDTFPMGQVAEFTVEAGRPDSITKDKLLAMQDHAVNRISINPQTMNQETLDCIGRKHTVEETVSCFGLAREMGFDNINMDLILGLPGEGAAEVERTMKAVATLLPDSLTVHSLALKRAARLKLQWEQYADWSMANSGEIMDLASAYARDMGLYPYYLYRQKNMAGNFENVGYARPGREGLYNILMMEETQTIAACGAGSISKRVRPDGVIERCENVKDLAQYMGRIGEMTERKRALFGV